MIVAISREKPDTEQFLSKKIGVFIRVVEFLFGPVTNEWVLSWFIRLFNFSHTMIIDHNSSQLGSHKQEQLPVHNFDFW